MKTGDKVWIPVTVVSTARQTDGYIEIEHENESSTSMARFSVDEKDIQTVNVEDYRNALSEFYEMDSKERSKIWGLNLLGVAFQITAEEFVGRLRKYQGEPKTGQIWKSQTGKKIVVFKADESKVHYYTPSGFETWCGRNYFENTFHNTGEVLTSLVTFLKDLEGLDEKG